MKTLSVRGNDLRMPGGLEVRLDHVTKQFGGVRAVDQVNLLIPAGSFVTLLGPSGSGKTTTLGLVAGFLSPDEGSILFDGQDVSSLAPQHRNIGMVFQSYALFPHMTVFDNVAYPLKMREKLDEMQLHERVREALSLVQLDQFEARYPRQLSGGQQQRVAMARAIVGRPRLLLMDEPLGALDKKLREQLQLEIKSIHRKIGATFIYVTHDQSEALTMSDLVVVMSNSKIAQIGSPQELYEAPISPFVADFLGGANLLPGEIVAEIEGQYELRLEDNTILHVSCAEKFLPGERIQLFIRPEDIRILGSADAQKLMSGRVDNVAYLGEALRINITIGRSLVMVKSPRGEYVAVSPGDVVGLKWSPRHARIFRVDGGGR